MPSLELERGLRRAGARLVAGVDEVGRGALAGPVLAGAVILSPTLRPSAPWLRGVDDSKKLTPRQRERAAEEIHRRALATATGAANAREIDRLGIVAATKLAMRRAVAALDVAPHALLVDYVSLEGCGVPFTSIPKADSRSYSVAAASIVAKVARDRFMVEAALRYPSYGFERHKGYGASAHLESLRRLGPCPLHRLSFAPCRAAHELHNGALKCRRTARA